MEEAATSAIDIISIVKDTINSLCDSVFSSINNTIFPLLDDIVFIDNRISDDTPFERLFGSSTSSGVLFLANSLLAAFVLYYSLRLLFSHFSGNNIDHPYKFFIKVILIAILMNSALSICNYMIDTASTLSDFFRELGNEVLGKKISFITLTNELNKGFDESFNMFSLNGILASTIYISSFSLALNFALRYILIKVLIMLAPFAFLCLLNEPIHGFFKSWIRAMISTLLLQVVVSIIILLPFTIMKNDSNSLFNNLLLIGSISLLIKSNQLVRDLIGGLDITASVQNGLSGIKNIISH